MQAGLRGVTLMELMIVVGVVAILAMAAYPALIGYIQKGYDTEAIEEIASLELTLAQYLIDNGTYIGASDNAAIQTNYGWQPATLSPKFDYRVSANTNCPTGVTVCYTVTASGRSGTPTSGRDIVKTSWGTLQTGGVTIR